MTVAAEKIKEIIHQLECLFEEKNKLSEEEREIFEHAKQEGLDPKILRHVLKIRRMKPEQRSEQEELIELYMNALI